MVDEWVYASGDLEDHENPTELADPGHEVPDLADEGDEDATGE